MIKKNPQHMWQKLIPTTIKQTLSPYSILALTVLLLNYTYARVHFQYSTIIVLNVVQSVNGVSWCARNTWKLAIAHDFFFIF